MSSKYKFRLTLKERSLKYFVHVIQAIDTLPKNASLQLLAKELMLSTIDFATTLMWFQDVGVIINLKANQTILQAIEMAEKKLSPLMQGLLNETKELIVMMEAAGRPSKS